MRKDIVLPSPGEGVTEVFVVSWLVSVGANVDVGTPILEVMTDKANIEVESSAAGRLVEQRFQADARVEVGQTIAIVETGGGTEDQHPANGHRE
jgi:2-oxoglutarate dehydrogenase E2 component (dihydrolipoamide succinyltransferase)